MDEPKLDPESVRLFFELLGSSKLSDSEKYGLVTGELLSAEPTRWIRSKDDIELVAKMGFAAFPEAISYDERAAMVVRYADANAQVFQFIVVEGVRIGYTSVIPMSPSSFQRHRAGLLSQYRFAKSDIDPPVPVPRAIALYLQAFVFDAEALGHLRQVARGKPDRAHYLKRLTYHHLARHVCLHNQDPVKTRPVMSAEGYYGRGATALDLCGFSRQAGGAISATGNPIFVLNTGHEDDLEGAGRTTLELLQFLTRRYRSVIEEEMVALGKLSK